MKRWIRMGSVVTATATALALGLASASAGPTGNDPPANPPTGSGNAQPSRVSLQDLPKSQMESLFKPVAPCRIVDTRRGGGIMTNNVPRSFYVSGTTGFAPQGGTSGGCGIPAAATGITTNVTATGTVSDGYLTGYPTGTTPPFTNFITTHKNFDLTANPTFALAAGNAKPLTITNHGGNTHVIVDVTGYYLPQIYAVLMYNGSATFADGVYRDGLGNRYATPRVISSRVTSPGAYEVTLDRDVSGCTPIASVYGGPFVASSTLNGNHVYAYMYTLQATTNSPTGTPTNLYWSLHVMC